MDIYFTIMIKENDTTNLKLLTEKLTQGFYINDRIEVGRSTVLTLRKREENRLGESFVHTINGTDINRVEIANSLTEPGGR